MVRGYSALATRLKRLEAKRRYLPTFSTVFFGIYDKEDSDIVGIGDGHGSTLDRLPGESVEALKARATAELPPARFSRFLRMVYAENPVAEAPPARESGWELPEPIPVDPWALAGIGRKATRAELERMGVVQIPAERLA